MMLLYFSAQDLNRTEAADFCAAQRRRGRILCLPAADTPTDQLAALPFTAAILHYHHDPAGLPDTAALHQAYPGLPLIAIGDPPDTLGRWRVIPGTDYELNGSAALEEYEPRLAMLQQARGMHIPAHTSLYLPADRHHAMVMTRRVAFSTDEFTLLRVLCAAQSPLPSALLCTFLAKPGSCPAKEAIGFHISRLKEKTTALNLPPLIRYIHPEGYTLASPYDIPLPAGAMHKSC